MAHDNRRPDDETQSDGVGGARLEATEPDERTDVATAPEQEPGGVIQASGSQPWIVVGLVLLIVFLAILVWSVVFPGTH
ncbi:MAG: hypothetical protein ACJ77N_00500 [Chloroflexota bacterium]